MTVCRSTLSWPPTTVSAALPPLAPSARPSSSRAIACRDSFCMLTQLRPSWAQSGRRHPPDGVIVSPDPLFHAHAESVLQLIQGSEPSLFERKVPEPTQRRVGDLAGQAESSGRFC